MGAPDWEEVARRQKQAAFHLEMLERYGFSPWWPPKLNYTPHKYTRFGNSRIKKVRLDELDPKTRALFEKDSDA